VIHGQSTPSNISASPSVPTLTLGTVT